MLTRSPAARTALVFVTAGALILIWTGVWYVYMRNHPGEAVGSYYLIGGLFATGLTILAIGLGVGRLGSAARNADTPTVVMTPAAPTPNTTTVLVPANAAAPSQTQEAPTSNAAPIAEAHRSDV